jgi:2-methylisocitrate lyase-like PEP mutase family enzyme
VSTTGSLVSAADRLRVMHHGPQPLVLPNVWDPVSARAFADAGFAALATSSAAVAATLGYRDGQTPGAEMIGAVARIARSVSVPVTADLEDGYGLTPAGLAERLAEAGVAGCNLEDSDPATGELTDPERQADFLAAVRAAAGPALVVNARVDVFVRGGGRSAGAGADAGADAGAATGAGADAAAEAVARAGRYLAAGAHCVYPILAPPAALAELVRRIGGPVNALLLPGGPGIAELAATGVARITFGGGLYRRAAQAIQGMATGLAAEVSALG